MDLRQLPREVVDEFREHDLLSSASAIAFQVVFATLPLVLLALAVMSFLGLADAWNTTYGPEARGALQPDSFSVLDRTVRQVLEQTRGLWLTAGLLLTIWRVSSLVRTAAHPLNRLYDAEEHRSFVRRFLVSVALACAVLPCYVVALALVGAGDEVIGALDLGWLGPVAWIVRWLIAGALLLLVVWLVLRYAPADRPDVRYASPGAGLVVVGWVVSTLLYLFYATEVASYSTVFGSLAAVVVLLTAAYILAIVFLGGVAVDARLRRRMD